MKKEFKNQLITGILSTPIVYIPHFHYEFIDTTLSEVIESTSKTLHLTKDSIVEYDLSRGIIDFETKNSKPNLDAYSNLQTLLNDIVEYDSHFDVEKIFVFKNFSEALADKKVQSFLQIFAQKYEAGFYDPLTTIIIISPQAFVSLPPELENIMTVVEVKAPNVDEINEFLVECLREDTLSDLKQRRIAADMVRTLQGLQMYEVKQTLKTVLALSNKRLKENSKAVALEEKKRIVKKSGIIEVIDTDVSFKEVGGLKRLYEDLLIKSKIYNNLGDAERYNIHIPKGILIIGMPGCGKSMIAQATANLFGVSLLRLDVSRLMGKYVGESEANLRLALATAEAAHPCVLWIDEIEKAFAGGNNKGGDNDMLVMRMMGHFLTWMQERKTPVYIVATANDVMRPEFMRKGRFDEVYFVDFPEVEERADILYKKIEKKYLSAKDCIFDFSEIIKGQGVDTDVVRDMVGVNGGFSGSEIECVLNMVVEDKFQSYLEQKDNANGQDFTPSTIRITKADFKKMVERIKSSVMSNQVSKKKDESELHRDKTSIERIKDMQMTYHFVNASTK